MSNQFNKRIVLAIVLTVMLTGCKNEGTDNYKGMSASQIYQQAEENMANENYALAVKDYEALECRYPYGEFSDKSQIKLIEAYYKHGDSALALTAADKYIRLNPRNRQVDYALYLKGLVTYDQNYNFQFRYLPLDRSSRDPSSAQESFDIFKELIERFPNSQYVPEARKRMMFLREQLASYEIQVAEYYLNRDANLSAANRATYILVHFQGTSIIPRALAVQVVAYRAMCMEAEANAALRTLQANYPDCAELRSCQ